MKKIFKIIGIILFILGLGAGDSTNLLIPLALLISGGIILWRCGCFKEEE